MANISKLTGKNRSKNGGENSFQELGLLIISFSLAADPDASVIDDSSFADESADLV